VFRSLFLAMLSAVMPAASSVSTANAADAQWVLLAESTDFAYYVDSTNITDLPNRNIKFRTLIDLITPDFVEGAFSYSAISQWQMDCNAGTIRLIDVSNFDDHCAGGAQQETDAQPPSKFLPVTPRSAFSIALKTLCLPAAVEDNEVITLERDTWLSSRPSGACSQ
jgi:hypothetical protein